MCESAPGLLGDVCDVTMCMLMYDVIDSVPWGHVCVVMYDVIGARHHNALYYISLSCNTYCICMYESIPMFMLHECARHQ